MKTLLGTLLLAVSLTALAQEDGKGDLAPGGKPPPEKVETPKTDAAKMVGGLDVGAGEKPAPPPKKAKPSLDVSKLPFTTDSIKQVVETHRGEVQDCYEAMLANAKKATEGTLMTSWVISRDGLVKHAHVEKKGTTLHDHELNECVVGVLTTMEFPKPNDKRDHPINFPFNLTAIH